MADPKPDADATEPIHFSEAYRRAKRNVLFWAVTTSVVAVGAHEKETLEVTGLVNGLAFMPIPILVGLLAILGFMVAGYIRAERDLVYLNTDQVVRGRASSAVEITMAVRDRLAVLRREVEGEEYRLRNIYDGANEALIQFDQSLDARTERWMAELDDKLRLKLPELQKLPARELERAISQFGRELGEDAKSLIREWEQLHRQYARDKPPAPSAEDADRVFGDVIDPFDKLAEQLTGLADAISVSQKAWFWAHDRGAVWLATVIALLLVVSRIWFGDTLDSLLGWPSEGLILPSVE